MKFVTGLLAIACMALATIGAFHDDWGPATYCLVMSHIFASYAGLFK